MFDQVILVDHKDNPVGVCEKLHAHQQGLCHRAFSIFIVSTSHPKKVLLHKRAHSKYHAANKWTNTCCSHPQPGQNMLANAKTRLAYEMGIDCGTLYHAGSHLYHHQFENGLIEHEYDHIFCGEIALDTPINPHPDEVSAHLWIGIPKLNQWLTKHPQQFTPWFAATWQQIQKYLHLVATNT